MRRDFAARVEVTTDTSEVMVRFLPTFCGSATERTDRRARRLVRRLLRQAWTISLPASAKPSASSRER